jgi:dTDP-4-dehydrorhamnose reductase
MSQRIVIIGAGGLVGTVLAAQATQRGHEVLALTSAQCDVTDATAVERHIDADDAVINASSASM